MSIVDHVRALSEGAGLVRRGRRRLIRTQGHDRVDYLHRMLSQDVAAIAPGTAAQSCVLNAQGRILGDPVLWNVGDAILLDLHQGAAASSIPHLTHHVITEDVTFEDASSAHLRFSLVGPRSADAIQRLGFERPEPNAHVTVDGEGWTARVLNRRLGSRPATEWIVAPRAAGDAFVQAFASVSVPLVRHSAFTVARVEERIPAWASELTSDVMPLEARLDETAISWTKGCYPGQEPVSKARYRGRPPNLLVRLDLTGPAVAGRILLDESRPAGRITTAIVDPRDGRARALGYVRFGLVRRDAILDMEGGGEARVLDEEVGDS